MNRNIKPSPLFGTVPAIPSKSMAHRMFICAALSNTPTTVSCQGTSNDIEATKACLEAMQHNPCRLPCGESGSTLRFLLPVVGALGLDASFVMEGRLPQRPLAPLDAQLEAHGVTLTRPEPNILRSTGKLQPGDYTLPGNITSQYISGLLFALPLLDGPSTLTVTGKIESAAYIEMTLSALEQFGVQITRNDNVYFIPNQPYVSPGKAFVEGDWSNAAFWLCAGAIGRPVTVTGLNLQSLQGDMAILDLLERFGAKVTRKGRAATVAPGPLHAIDIDAGGIPDLVPILSVVAAAAPGTTTIYNAARLRLKESDRIATVHKLLEDLGADVEETEDSLLIHGGKPLLGQTVDSCNDHRIAMSAAIASILCRGEVTVTDAEAVNKSYPRFWREFYQLTMQDY